MEPNLILKSIDRCPVCGSVNRDADPGGMAAKKEDKGYHYIKYGASKLGISVKDFVRTAKVYRCRECRTRYCDPWFAPEVASSIFTTGAPDHMAGWAEYETWLSGSRLTPVQKRNRRIAEIVESRLGDVSTYAEYGCPFQGLLLHYTGIQNLPPDRISRMVSAMKKERDLRRPRVARWVMEAMQISRFIAFIYHWCRYMKESWISRLASSVGVNPPKKMWLLTKDSSTFWSNNCVRYGNSCRYFAAKSFNVSVLPLEELTVKVDLVGLFNVLDHTSEPLEVLKALFLRARAVLVVTHTAEQAGKQHLYAFADDFYVWLQSSLGVTCEDLTAEISGSDMQDYNCTLITLDS